jgi:hypothetical protein
MSYSFFNLGAIWGKLGDHCTGRRMGLGADMDGSGKSRPHGVSNPGPSSS